MIIYEVNLSIQADIFDDYMHWLLPHVEKMLTFSGFKKATCFKQIHDPANDGFICITLQYALESMAHLDHYLSYHASGMREDALKRFPGLFTATRRIFQPEFVISGPL